MLILLALAVLPAIDSLIRLMLLVVSRGHRRDDGVPAREDAGVPRPFRWLVVVPSRDEGEAVRKTLESVRDVPTLLLLDGEDVAAQRVAEELGAAVVVKESRGPTKAAALAWLAETQRDRLLATDAVLLLDVGSTVGERFFENLHWPAECDAVQARLSGVGSGVGVAVAASETHAQLDEDRGRQSLGWSVRLRGTGSAFRPATFIAISPRLRTRVEDLEATLLMIARGQRVALGGPEAVVIDEKPLTVYWAASQRARWLLGRYEVLFKRAGELGRAVVRRPAETTALFFEIFGRPLSLTIPFRVIVAAVGILSGRFVIIASAILATAVLDVVTLLASGRTTASAAMRLMMAWGLAVLMAPRALFRWMRAKRL